MSELSGKETVLKCLKIYEDDIENIDRELSKPNLSQDKKEILEKLRNHSLGAIKYIKDNEDIWNRKEF